MFHCIGSAYLQCSSLIFLSRHPLIEQDFTHLPWEYEEGEALVSITVVLAEKGETHEIFKGN